MIRYRKRVWFLSALLAGLAGFLDAVGFLYLGGYFVSFMSGNSTRLGVGVTGDVSAAMLAASLLGVFVFGVVTGTLFGKWMDDTTRVLWLVCGYLVGASVLHGFGYSLLAVLTVAMAMGAENTIFQREGEVSIGLTYMTGTLVKIGQHLAHAMSGGPRWKWMPYLLLWLGMVFGAAIGALSYARLGLSSIFFAAAIAVPLALLGTAATR